MRYLAVVENEWRNVACSNKFALCEILHIVSREGTLRPQRNEDVSSRHTGVPRAAWVLFACGGPRGRTWTMSRPPLYRRQNRNPVWNRRSSRRTTRKSFSPARLQIAPTHNWAPDLLREYLARFAPLQRASSTCVINGTEQRRMLQHARESPPLLFDIRYG